MPNPTPYLNAQRRLDAANADLYAVLEAYNKQLLSWEVVEIAMENVKAEQDLLAAESSQLHLAAAARVAREGMGR